jgi:hypothetical protein
MNNSNEFVVKNADIPPGCLTFRSECVNGREIASISADGILRFTIAATDENAKGPSREWLEKMAEIEDGECVSVGGLAVETGCYSAPDPRTRLQKLRDRLFPSQYCCTPEAPSDFKDCIHGSPIDWRCRHKLENGHGKRSRANRQRGNVPHRDSQRLSTLNERDDWGENPKKG